MKQALAPVAALLISVSILLTGQGLQGALLPMRATLENFSPVAVGAMGAAYFFGFTLGCLKAGELVRRVGHVRVFLSMTALASAAPLVHALVVIPWPWGLLRLVTGFCFAVIYVVIESWLNEQSSNENRGFVFSAYTMINLTVLAVGQMMTLLYNPSGIELFAIASVLVSLAAIPVALSVSPTPEVPQSAKVDLPKLFRVSPTGALGCLVTGLANGAFWSLAPVFTFGATANIADAAGFMTAAVIGGAIAQWPIGVASDRIGRRPVLLAISVFGAIAGIALVYLSGHATLKLLFLLAAAWGAVAFPLYAIAVAYTNDLADPSEYVEISSALLLVYGIGAIVGPFVASTAMSLFGSGMLFVYTAATHALLLMFAFYRFMVSSKPRHEESVEFGDALTSVQTASQVYEEEVWQQSDDDGPDETATSG
jgi:MFS family permease